ncbi:MAG: zinc-dependent alcohol dehydrogenase family protein [Acidiferrobacterales bacterium]
MNTMQAVLMSTPGEPDVLRPVEIPVPGLPSPSHLRVRLYAAGINPIDSKLRRNGTYYPDQLQSVLGCDGAGVVDAVGDSVKRFRPGDEVYFFQGGIGGEQGTYAQYVTVHEEYAAAKPSRLSFIEAAALPLVLITAWEALYDRADLRSRQRVLVHAGAGGVGHIAVQLARNAGARVATTVSGDQKAAFVRSLGAEQVIDYRRQDFVQAALDWSDGEGVDISFDTAGGATFCRSFAATRVYGRIITILQASCEADAFKTARLRNQSISYELMLTPQLLGMHEARCAQCRILERGVRMIDEGTLGVTVSRVLPLAEAAEAHRLIEAGHTTGKIVLSIE